MKAEYNHPEYTHTMSADHLSKEDRDTQLEVMRTWFFQNYRDPVEECPYDGGYIYIWGGPYDAGQELHAEFGEVVPEEVIDALVEDLQGHCWEWSGIPDDNDFDEYFLDAVGSATDPFADLCLSLERLEELLGTQLPSHLGQIFLQMIFVNAITALEAYLSEFFIKEVSGDETKLRAFVESNPDFKKKRISLSDIFERSETIKETVRKYLSELLWHNLPKVKPMFGSTLQIEFPDSLKELISAIHRRHDLVHRGGKTKEGEIIALDQSQVAELLNRIRVFAKHIESAKPIPDF